MKLTVYWATKDRGIIRRIRERFGIPNGITVNYETPCEIKDEDLQLLEETAKRGFIQIRKKKQ